MEIIVYALVGVYAGFAGSLLGIGGGVIVVPALVGFLGVPIHNAIATSLVTNTAVSVLSVIRKTDNGLVNIPLGLLLSITTVMGVLVGVRAGRILPPSLLEGCFLVFAAVMCASMIRKLFAKPDNLEELLKNKSIFTQSFKDRGKTVTYSPQKTPLSLFLSVFAGMISGVLGVGGGVLQIPILNTISKIPLKPAGGTSNLIIVFTSGAAALSYFRSGHTLLEPAAHLIVWLCLGVWLGTKVLDRVNDKALAILFVAVMLLVSLKMVFK